MGNQFFELDFSPKFEHWNTILPAEHQFFILIYCTCWTLQIIFSLTAVIKTTEDSWVPLVLGSGVAYFVTSCFHDKWQFAGWCPDRPKNFQNNKTRHPQCNVSQTHDIYFGLIIRWIIFSGNYTSMYILSSNCIKSTLLSWHTFFNQGTDLSRIWNNQCPLKTSASNLSPR